MCVFFWLQDTLPLPPRRSFPEDAVTYVVLSESRRVVAVVVGDAAALRGLVPRQGEQFQITFRNLFPRCDGRGRGVAGPGWTLLRNTTASGGREHSLATANPRNLWYAAHSYLHVAVNIPLLSGGFPEGQKGGGHGSPWKHRLAALRAWEYSRSRGNLISTRRRGFQTFKMATYIRPFNPLPTPPRQH